MKKQAIFLFFLITLSQITFADKKDNNVIPLDTSIIDDDSVFLAVENPPIFPGSELGLIKFIIKNTKYPDLAKKNNVEGRVDVSFVVEKDGSVSNIKVVNGIGGGCDEEAIRVIRTLPKFSPGLQNNKPARVLYNIPVHFKLWD